MARRGKGEGSVYQRSDGRWAADFTCGVDPSTGRPKRKTIYGKTKTETRKRLNQALAQIESGTYVEPLKLTVGEWLDTWMHDYKNDLKPATRLSYEQHIRNHIRPALGGLKLTQISAVDVQRFCNHLTEKGLTAKTVKNVHGVLHGALEQAMNLEFIPKNPARIGLCTLPKREKAEVHPLELSQQRFLLATLGEDVFSSAMRLALFSGMRQGEILGLQWDCVDFERGNILIDKQLLYPRQKGAGYSFGTPKNGKARTIHPAPLVMRLLKDRRRQQLEERLQAGVLWNDHGFPNLVFTNAEGRYLNFQTVEQRFYQALQRAGVERHRFHDLRHTYAVNSLLAGDDPKTLQENLGHHSAAFTLEQYAHFTDTMRSQSAQRQERFLNAALQN